MTKKIIMDCDPGHDDAIALILAGAKQSPLDIIAVTTVAGNQSVEKNTNNALNVLDIMGRLDIEVSVGASRPLIKDASFASEIHGETGLDGPNLPKVPALKPTTMHAVDTIIEKVSHSDTKVTIVATGPLTNIAMAMNKEPNIVQNIESITIMGGGTFGNWTPTAEFNIWVDAEAAKRVFESGVMINVFGLDVTHQVLATDEIISRFKGIDNEIARFVVELLEFFKSTYKTHFNMDGGPIHDACTILYLLQPELFTMQYTRIDIECQSDLTYGTMSVDLNDITQKEKNANFAIAVDVNDLWDLVENILQSYNKL
ncbi:nucleoside hydrolase [Staphylococcus gallinarum]|uniref:Inosine/uridine-preferring nucleoside hydrolase domain-containing protein n=1 Tax=Staphylococcus gallinarum TaxID=1293 RepID=A0ABQ0Y3Q4_STAGA|nr:nucleoside hydrolase [Staphylococcus gallinarum]KIR10103.1 nucleoside hydrolase [Staphylococcus gallinarum]MCD8920187.1 nucleoside hydrolase [Staphylococcus gallinarum]MEB6278686.1 nucleoside hydrolase [Staphylococcus gallinarum]RTX82484.1 nucleoside hydrolase [Staphylococcus gallinarum]UEG99638.1 nucleoside hydrolase [Staphylococcus gallinarum]